MVQAMRDHDEARLSALRMMKAALKKQEVDSMKPHEGAVRALLSTPWGLVSGGEDGVVRLWGAPGPIVLHRHGDFVTGLCAGRRRVWSTGYDGRLLWSRAG